MFAIPSSFQNYKLDFTTRNLIKMFIFFSNMPCITLEGKQVSDDNIIKLVVIKGDLVMIRETSSNE